jgi:hypothetical protein
MILQGRRACVIDRAVGIALAPSVRYRPRGWYRTRAERAKTTAHILPKKVFKTLQYRNDVNISDNYT